MASVSVISFAGRISLSQVLGVGSEPSQPGAIIGKLRLPTDPIGVTTVTFSGVVTGSEIRVFDISANELAGIESAAANQVLSWSVFSPGSPNNSVTVRIISELYEVTEIALTSELGTTTVPIKQRADRNYFNP